MKNTYKNPTIEVNVFDIENVVTDSTAFPNHADIIAGDGEGTSFDYKITVVSDILRWIL